MKLSSKSRYALEGLMLLALTEDGETMAAKELSEKLGTTPAYLEQIFFKLKHAGLVSTVRGVRGGFVLGKAQEEISVGEIVRAVEGTVVPVKCVENPAACKSRIRSTCVSRRVWVRISDAMRTTADGITLGSLCREFREQEGGAV